jgi:hypothetical protein
MVVSFGLRWLRTCLNEEEGVLDQTDPRTERLRRQKGDDERGLRVRPVEYRLRYRPTVSLTKLEEGVRPSLTARALRVFHLESGLTPEWPEPMLGCSAASRDFGEVAANACSTAAVADCHSPRQLRVVFG